MAKYLLHTNDDDLDFNLTGIVCPEDQYRLTALINQELGTQLQLNSFLPFNLRNGKTFTFSLFSFVDEDLGIQYDLIPNTSNFDEANPANTNQNSLFAAMEVEERVKLIKELPKTDYFLLIKGDELHNFHHLVIDKLKSIPQIIRVQAIEPSELPSRRNLIF